MGIEESEDFDARRDGRLGASEKIFKMIKCPRAENGCDGIAVAVSGEGIELEQRESGYIIRMRDGREAFGNCSRYQECYNQIISQSERKSAQIKLEN